MTLVFFMSMQRILSWTRINTMWVWCLQSWPIYVYKSMAILSKQKLIGLHQNLAHCKNVCRVYFITRQCFCTKNQTLCSPRIAYLNVVANFSPPIFEPKKQAHTLQYELGAGNFYWREIISDSVQFGSSGTLGMKAYMHELWKLVWKWGTRSHISVG